MGIAKLSSHPAGHSQTLSGLGQSHNGTTSFNTLEDNLAYATAVNNHSASPVKRFQSGGFTDAGLYHHATANPPTLLLETHHEQSEAFSGRRSVDGGSNMPMHLYTTTKGKGLLQSTLKESALQPVSKVVEEVAKKGALLVPNNAAVHK
jgi:hypothetical protein